MPGESLRVISGKSSGTEISLEDDFLIGRAAPGEGSSGRPGDLAQSRPGLRGPDGRLMVEDLGSRTAPASTRSGSASSEPLAPGDTIKVGTTTLQLLDSEGNAFQATALAGSGDAGATRASVPAAAATPRPRQPPRRPRHRSHRAEPCSFRRSLPPGARSPAGRGAPSPCARLAPAAAPSFQPGGPVPPHPATRGTGGAAAGPCSAAWGSWPRPSSWASSCWRQRRARDAHDARHRGPESRRDGQHQHSRPGARRGR